MRLVLFDVDGTLLTASGAGRRALACALEEVYGTAGPIERYDFRGGTDPQIIRDLLRLAGVADDVIEAREAALYARYAECLEAEIGDGAGVRLYPGVRDLVEALASRDDVLVGLLTGNIEAGARLKIRPTGLWSRFRLGAYGSDHADRTRLPLVAARRAEALVRRVFGGTETVIIGDTLDGDELIVHPANPERIYVLPRHSEDIHVAGDGLPAAVEWLCGSGTLTEPFEERDFEPIDRPQSG